MSVLGLIFIVFLGGVLSARIGMVTCPDKSHAFLFTKVGKVLVERGHEVFFCIRNHDFTGDNQSGIHYNVVNNWFTEEERANFRKHLTSLDFLSAEIEDTEWMFKDYQLAMNSSCVPYFKKMKIDFFLFDPLYIVNFLFVQQLDVPNLALSPNGLYDPILSYVFGSDNTLSYLPQGATGQTNNMNTIGRALNMAIWFVDYLYLNYFFWKLEKLALAHNLLPFSDPKSKFGRQILLLQLQTGFDYPRQVATNVKYIGPIMPSVVANPLSEAHSEILKSPKKTILLSFGTTFYHKTVLFTLVEGLSRYAVSVNDRRELGQLHPSTEIQIMVACRIPAGDAEEFQALLKASKYIIHSEWIPQNDILAHPNVVLFVSHGGLNGILESLFHGKPVLGVPLVHDHEENMMKVVATNTGLYLSKFGLSAERVASSAREILNDHTYNERALHLSKIFKNAGPLKGADAVAFWIEYTLNVGSVEHLVTNSVVSGSSTISLYNLDIIGLLLAVFYLGYRISKRVFSALLDKLTA